MLSRWRKLGSETDLEGSGAVEPGLVQVKYVTVYACPDADYSLPLKSAIKDKQLELLGLVGRQTSVRTMFGPATPHGEERFWVERTGRCRGFITSGKCKGPTGSTGGFRVHR